MKLQIERDGDALPSEHKTEGSQVIQVVCKGEIHFNFDHRVHEAPEILK